MVAQLEIPTELEFLEFFGAEPIEKQGADGFWLYEVTDRNRVTLRFSFNVFERSVQTTLLFSGVVVSVVSHEAADHMKVNGHSLECVFSSVGSKTRLAVTIEPLISVLWSTLETEA